MRRRHRDGQVLGGFSGSDPWVSPAFPKITTTSLDRRDRFRASRTRVTAASNESGKFDIEFLVASTYQYPNAISNDHATRPIAVQGSR